MTSTTGGDVTPIDISDLRARVQDVYRDVAEAPDAGYHFETGRGLAVRLGYPADLLDRVPPEAVESFAGVGWFFDLAGLRPGERVLDLGSGSGTDVFVAAELVGRTGQVTGIDMTAAQRDKAERLRRGAGLSHVAFVAGHIEDLPLPDRSVDCVISNGVINLSPDKEAVFREAARVLCPGGRLALADIVTRVPLPPAVVGDTRLWAACIGGAVQHDEYQEAITGAGFELEQGRRNAYEFLSDSARTASRTYGVMSVSLAARRG
jgi:ubiquinone/menaquinone biosynthesis C-methylase UbiE